jgi:hypothetical protein
MLHKVRMDDGLRVESENHKIQVSISDSLA